MTACAGRSSTASGSSSSAKGTSGSHSPSEPSKSAFDVVGFDLDANRIKLTGRRRAPTSRTSPTIACARRLRTGRYQPTDDPELLAGFDVAVDRRADAARRTGSPTSPTSRMRPRTLVGRHLRPWRHRGARVDQLPGHDRGARGPDPRGGLGPDRPGRTSTSATAPSASTRATPTWTLENTPKVVSGSTTRRSRPSPASTGDWSTRTVAVSGTREAELTKLLENTFRHVNIALVNELAMFAADLGIDVWEAIDAASTKPFGYMRFTPGPGVGGHCLPIDPSYLSWKVRRSLGQPFRFVELANDVNEHMPDYVVRRLIWPSTAGAARSAAPGSSCWVWPTSATPGTPARPRARSSPGRWRRSAPTCGSPTRTCPATPCAIRWCDLDRRRADGGRRGGAW